MTVTPEEEEES